MAYRIMVLGLLVAACTAEPQIVPAPPVPVASACRPVQDAATALAHRYGIRRVYRLSGDSAARFMRSYNASEPVSDMRADTVLVMARGDLAAVLFGLNDCVVHIGSAPLERVKAWASGLATGETGA